MSWNAISRGVIFLLLASLVTHAFAADPEVYPRLKVSIPRMTAPRIDGDLTDIGWTEVGRKGGSTVVDLLHSWQHAPIRRIEHPRIVYLGYDNEALYVSVINYHPDPKSLAEPENGWLGDAFTLCVQPDPTS